MRRFLEHKHGSSVTQLPHKELIELYCTEIKTESPSKKYRDAFLMIQHKTIGSPIYVETAIPLTDRQKRIRVKRKKKWTYKSYLKSVEWKKFKASLVEKRGHRCEHCGNTKARLDGHHVTYVRLYRELPEDVLLLCRKCHKLQHPEKNV